MHIIYATSKCELIENETSFKSFNKPALQVILRVDFSMHKQHTKLLIVAEYCPTSEVYTPILLGLTLRSTYLGQILK